MWFFVYIVICSYSSYDVNVIIFKLLVYKIFNMINFSLIGYFIGILPVAKDIMYKTFDIAMLIYSHIFPAFYFHGTFHTNDNHYFTI